MYLIYGMSNQQTPNIFDCDTLFSDMLLIIFHLIVYKVLQFYVTFYMQRTFFAKNFFFIEE